MLAGQQPRFKVTWPDAYVNVESLLNPEFLAPSAKGRKFPTACSAPAFASEFVTRQELQLLGECQLEARHSLARDPSARWKLESGLLYELITYGDGLERKRWVHAGNWNNQKEVGPRAVLTWLVMRAFGIHRLPWLNDRVFSCHLPSQATEMLDALREPSEVDAACAELRELHEHCVRQLRERGLDPLVLDRSVDDQSTSDIFGTRYDGYATRLVQQACAAHRLGRLWIKAPFDVLSSWTPGGYPMPVTMQRASPASEVAWANCFVSSRSNRHDDAVESDEWVVVCRNPEGILNRPGFPRHP